MKSNFFIDFHNAENNADYNGYARQGEQEIAEQACEEIALTREPRMLRARKSRKAGSERAESRIRAENYVISDNAPITAMIIGNTFFPESNSIFFFNS